MVDVLEKSKLCRKKILDSIMQSGKGHVGGAFSVIDILCELYYNHLDIEAIKKSLPCRDRFILSKGHAAIALYAVLQDLGFFEESELLKMNAESILGEHPDNNIPGIEIDTGSLGHGLGLGLGMALAAKLDKVKYNTYVLLGDGECYEGSVWEAATLASHLQLNNLVAIVDRNKLCIHGKTEEINKLEPFADKWKAFGWNAIEINGHDNKEIKSAILSSISKDHNKPTVIIAHTVKGKGVSFMENDHRWHHGGINKDQYEKAIHEISN